jgi:hypothetical protein
MSFSFELDRLTLSKVKHEDDTLKEAIRIFVKEEKMEIGKNRLMQKEDAFNTTDSQ